MRDYVQQYFKEIYGLYLEEQGYFRCKKVYYKIEKEKELVYFVSLDKGRWGRALDVNFAVWPFCPEIDMRITAYENSRLANEFWKVAGLPIGGWEYDRESEQSIKHAVEESYKGFQKVAVPILNHVVDAETHYLIDNELEQVLSGQIILIDAGKIYECLNLHRYEEALLYIEHSIEHTKNAALERARIFGEESIEGKGYDEDIKRYADIGTHIKTKDYAYLDAIVECEKEKTRESIRTFFRHFDI